MTDEEILQATYAHLDETLTASGVDWQSELGDRGHTLYDQCEAMADLAGVEIGDAMATAIERSIDGEL